MRPFVVRMRISIGKASSRNSLTHWPCERRDPLFSLELFQFKFTFSVLILIFSSCTQLGSSESYTLPPGVTLLFTTKSLLFCCSCGCMLCFLTQLFVSPGIGTSLVFGWNCVDYGCIIGEWTPPTASLPCPGHVLGNPMSATLDGFLYYNCTVLLFNTSIVLGLLKAAVPIVSWNIRGLQNPLKRTMISTVLRKHLPPSVLYRKLSLQWTHCPI